MPSPRARLRAGVLLTTTIALVLGTSAIASAHVRVTSDSTTVGDDANLTFHVPTESESASTVKIVVTLPTDHPLIDVTPQFVTGFSAQVVVAALPSPVVIEGTTLTKAPHQVVWAATGNGIPPEQFGDFGLAVEGLPDAAQLEFPTAQYYSDGTVVQWDQPTPAGGTEPEHPTPTLVLTSAADTTSPSAAPTASATVQAESAPAADTSSGSSGTAGVWLGVVALVVALAALVVSLVRGRGRSTPAPAATPGNAPEGGATAG